MLLLTKIIWMKEYLSLIDSLLELLDEAKVMQ